MRGIAARIFIGGVLFCLGIAVFRANAAGVVLTLSDGSGIADAGSGGRTEITTTWTTSGFYASGTRIVLSISPAPTSTIANCGPADTQFAYAADGAFSSFATSQAIYTLDRSVATGTTGALCLSFGLGTSTSNYLLTMQASSSTSSFNTTDFGGALYDVGNGQQVDISATIPASLSFSIRNATDTASTNACQLGTLALDAVSSCSYRLRVATNAVSGFTMTLEPSGPFNSSGSATMTAITNDAAFVAGTEAYGLSAFTGATSGGRSGVGDFDQPASEAGTSIDASLTFNVDSTPLDFTTATTVLSYTGPFNALGAPSPTTTTLVVHSAAVGAGTIYGSYSQVVTYRVTGSY